MKTIITYFVPFLGKHWLRIGIVGIFLFVLNKKQLDFSIQLGSPPTQQLPPTTTPPAPTPSLQLTGEQEAPVLTQAGHAKSEGWLSQMNIFSTTKPAPERLRQLQSVDEAVISGFIQRFSHVAKTEQDKYGIPASITLANALIHSKGGRSELSLRNHNYFNLSCTSDWRGPEARDNGQCFRAYQNAWTSFRDHSLFVTTGPYTNLSQLGKKNYRAWATALADKGFNQTPDLALQLLTVIDQWQLFQYD